jgi:hypothetical protein
MGDARTARGLSSFDGGLLFAAASFGGRLVIVEAAARRLQLRRAGPNMSWVGAPQGEPCPPEAVSVLNIQCFTICKAINIIIAQGHEESD